METRQILIDIFKSLDMEVFYDIYTANAVNTPNIYVLIRYDINNYSTVRGDGHTLVRSSDCDLAIVSDGSIDHNKDIKYAEVKVEKILHDNNIEYTKIGNIYSPNSGQSRVVYSFTLWGV